MAARTQLKPSALPGQRYGSFAGRSTVFATAVDGSRTALHEQIGNSVIASFTGEYRLRLPYGYGGARLYALSATAAGGAVVLPDITLCSVGGIPTVTLVNYGAVAFDVVTREGDILGSLLPAGSVSLLVLPPGPSGGGWFVRPHATVGFGAVLPDRVFVDLRLTESQLSPFNLRARVAAMGFADDHVAYALRCTMAAGVVIGSNTTAVPAFDTGSWHAGSTLLLVMENGAWITGRGGNGGRGGDVPPGLLAQPGQNGGTGFRMRLQTALVSAGTIQGGGGGGGAHAYLSTTPGAGGGGGAGYGGGDGGVSGNHAGGGPYPGGDGLAGSISFPGGGGATPAGSGAYGGLPGAGGSAANSAGGTAGNAIEKMGNALTKIRAGTIHGPEVA